MILSKAQLQAALDAMPAEIELPDEWPTPNNTPGAYARVMSFDVRYSSGPSISVNMEKVDADGAVHRPEWQKTVTQAQCLQDPVLWPFAVLTIAGLTGIAAQTWGVMPE